MNHNNIEDVFPMSDIQKGMVLLSVMRPEEAVYHDQLIYQTPRIDPVLFEKALALMIEKHATLRTYFDLEKYSMEVQLIAEQISYKVAYEDISHLAAKAQEQHIKQYIARERQKPFNFKQAPLWRISIFHVSRTDSVFVFQFHHAIMDGWSVASFNTELFQICQQLQNDPTFRPALLKATYKDAVLEEFAQKKNTATIDFWKKEMADYKRLDVFTQERMVASFKKSYDVGFAQKMRSRIAADGISLQTASFAAFLYALSRLSIETDLTLGLVSNTRPAIEDGDKILGCFLNTLPFRFQMKHPHSWTWREFFLAVDQKMNVLKKNNQLTLLEITKATEERPKDENPFFDILFNFVDFHIYREINSDAEEAPESDALDLESYEVTNTFVDLTVSTAGGMLHFNYIQNKALRSGVDLKRLHAYVDRVLECYLEQPSLEVGRIELFSELEQKQLAAFQLYPADFPQGKTFIQLFEAQVDERPDATALVFQDRTLSYRELNEVSNQLARYLQANYQLKPEDLAVVKLKRSEWMIVAILGILKTGAAYVPIDVKNPSDRIAYIETESNSKLSIDQNILEDFQKQQDDFSKDNLPLAAEPHHLAYIIYTSGSTGKPKGVMVEHCSVVDMAFAWKKEYQIGPDTRLLQLASVAFDVSVGDMCRTLLFGGQLIICPSVVEVGIEGIVNLMCNHQITFLESTPVLVVPLMDHIYEQQVDVSSLEILVVGSDVCPVGDFKNLLDRFGSQMRILNSYGTTETTIDSSYFEGNHTADVSYSASVPIGKPLPNVAFFVLDTFGQPLPLGVIGELCIGGICVTRGYLNRPELTAQKFVENTFLDGQKIYRTGDLARWLPSGDIELLGRMDNQVKIRGFRVELGEIAASLQGLDSIREAVVVAKEIHPGEKELVAYLVSEKPQLPNELRYALSEHLPDYMLPSHFVQLEALPVSPNGKVDVKALPMPLQKRPLDGVAFQAPTTDQELALAAVWQDVLKRKEIGLQDNFYHLGGDSIKSIQVVSRLKQKGFSLRIEQLLRHPVLENAARFLEPLSRQIDQSEVKGEVVLTPAQLYCFSETAITQFHHYNQSLVLACKEPMEADLLDRCMEALVAQHDALRMTFRKTKGTWMQFNEDTSQKRYSIYFHDLRTEAAPLQRMQELGGQIQASFDLSEGPMVKVGHFRLADGDRLALIIHHLVVDGVSWRILLEDFSNIYHQLKTSVPVSLPPKSDAFQRWAKLQKEFAQSEEMQQELTYWQSACHKDIRPIPKKALAEGTPVVIDERLSFSLDKQATNSFLTNIHNVYNTDANDVLLTSLGLAVREVFGLQKVVLEMEGHGREDIIRDVDISRTVGWFTSIFPFVLDVQASDHPRESLVAVKESLRRIPRKGIGYGMLKYLTEAGRSLEFQPSIVFNYLGEFGGSVGGADNPYFDYSADSAGPSIDECNEDSSLLDVSGMLVDEALTLTIGYSEAVYEPEAIRQLCKAFEKHLHRLIDNLAATDRSYKTPSDLTFKDISVSDLQKMEALYQVEDVYPLSPLQQGFYYHWLAEPDSSMYFEQMSYRISGGQLDLALIQTVFDQLVNRYGVLKTSFSDAYSDTVLQIVHREVNSRFSYQKLFNLSDQEIEWYVKEIKLKDRQQGFDLAQPSQMRLKVLDLGKGRYEFIWSHHHILMDGWCMSILINDFYNLLDAAKEQRPAKLSPPLPYAHYIQWLEGIDKAHSLKYWGDYLNDYSNVAEVPFRRNTPAAYQEAKAEFQLEGALFEQLQGLFKEVGITPSTFVQACWGYLLSRYNNKQDVVFGSVVSGRPASLPGVEQMVGLFINTIPVRVRYTGDQSPIDLLKTLQEHAIAGNEHHYLNLSEVQSQSELGRDLINHILVFENYPVQNLIREDVGQTDDKESEELEIEAVEVFEQTNYDFNLLVMPSEQAFTIEIKYNLQQFEEESIERIGQHLLHVIQQFAEQPNQALKEVSYLTEAETQELLYTYNDCQVDYPKGKTMETLFEEQCRRTPERTAVVFRGKRTSYAELEVLSNRLANYLKRSGLQPGQPVPIVSHKDLSQVWGVLGILKAGGYYVPIKGDLPVERIKELLDQTQAEFVLVQEEHRSKIADLDNIHQIHLDEANFMGEATTFDKPPVPDTNLAYIIFTSGSSGKPKGVMIDHRGAVNTLYDMNARFEVTEKDVVFGISDLNFDLSVYDIFGVLACGACLVLPEEAERQDPTSWLRYVGQEKASVWNSVPQIAALLADAAEESDDKKVLSSLRLCWMSGDWIPTYLPDKLRSLSPKLRPISLGGATEASIWSIHYPINEVKEEWASIPYGMPLGNQQMYVLDDFMEPCPYGVVGNIFIGGVGVAKGYFKDEQKTAASFIPNEKLGGIIYRTGDMGCYHKDGYIVFLGRNDGQVKVRGFRIELGEIEHHLQSQKAIQEAIVMAKEGLSGSKELVAYVLVKEDLNKEQVYEHLRNQLPDYMVPAMIIDLKEFPMTSNGKVNRKALPEPDLTELMAQKFVAPRTDVERQLVEIWQKVLGHERIGIHDNFFQIGGDSIVSIRLIGKINKAFGCSFKIGQLYERSNIAAQAEWLEGHAGVSDEYEKRRREVEQSFAQLRESLFSTALDSNVIQDVYPLSDIQRGMSLLSIIHPDEGVYHNQYPYQIHKVDEALFEKALSLMVAKHDILRTGFDLENYEQELQLIHKEVPVVVDFVDLVGQTATAQKQFIDAYAAQERHRPFDFQKPPLWRASVFHIDDRQSIFFFQFHHAILDGWSLASFNTELFQIYMALKEDASFQLKPLTTSFRDSVIEERTEKLMPQSSEFWKTALADYKRLDVFSAEPTAVLLRKRYDGTFLQRLRDKSKTDGLSLQTVFFGAYAFALKMLSYEEDIVLGLVSNNRPMVEDADKVLGCFLNTLPVRIKFQEMRDISWIAYLKKLDRQLKQLMSQSRLTLMEIAKVASDEPSQSNPFFDAIFNFLDFHIYNDIASSEQSDASEQEEEELNLDSYAVSNTLLDLDVSLTGQSLNFDYRLGRSLKSGISLEQFHAYLEKVLMCYLDQASEKMRSGNVLSEREQQFLLTSYSPAAPTATDRPTVVELFAKQVAEKPDQIALVFEDKRWSYRQLDQQANQLAAYLQERCQPAADDCIGLLLPRNEWLITAMLAVLKAGAAYVPIDPDYPEVRKNYILEDASCKLILDETELANFQQVADHYPHTAPAVTPKASDLMYLIYTSGSTGRPKGVMLEHASVAAFLNGLDAQLGYEEAQIIAATTNVTFDISVLEIFGTLCSGRQLVLFGEGQIDPEAFVQKLQEEKVELLQLTPSRLMQFTDILFQKMLPSLKHLLVGGEVFPEKIYERRAELSDIRIVNVYGPTETTIWSAALHIHQSTQLSIGQPLDNEQIYILNPSGDLQTIGVVGEICIGGAGLARGYWKRPELTKERFIQHPFIPGERLYKTGDLGRWCEDGNIEYLGRFDEQVKIRGHRIELGEIETAMAGYAASWQQIVVLAKERNGEQVLAAYFVAGETVDKLALRTYLQGQLPAYMIPAYFIELKEMLLTASGKVNKKALPGISEEDVIRKEFVEASNETELALMKYWQEVLDIRRISVTDNFFEVGGNSILVVRLFHKLKAELCDSLKITDLFNQTTIRQQAALIKTQEEPALMEINEIDF